MYVGSVIIETLKSAQIASVVPIFIKDLVVVYLNDWEKEHYFGVMSTIQWKKKRLRKRKTPKGFEGW